MRKYPAWFGKGVTKKGHEFSFWDLVGILLHSKGEKTPETTAATANR